MAKTHNKDGENIVSEILPTRNASHHVNKANEKERNKVKSKPQPEGILTHITKSVI